MTRLALAHYALIAVLAFAAGWASRDATAMWASGPEPGTSDPEVARFLAPNMIADDRSALTLDGQGVRFVGQEGGGGIVTPVPVPVPPMLPVFAIALAALIWKGWK